MNRLQRLLTALLGAPCRYGCGQRVQPHEVTAHEHYDHAGDTRPRSTP